MRKGPITSDARSTMSAFMTEQQGVRPDSNQHRSLAEELRLMNQMRDHIAQERRSMQYEKHMVPQGHHHHHFDQVKANRIHAVPKQIDNSGTSLRVRPQTPKLNLLGQKKKQMPNRLPTKLASIQTANVSTLQKQIMENSNSGTFAIPKIGKGQKQKSSGNLTQVGHNTFSGHNKFKPAAPSEQDRSQGATTQDTFSTAKDMLMAKMLNNDGRKNSQKRETSQHRDRDKSKGAESPQIRARENSEPKRIKIYKKKDLEPSSASKNRYDSKYEISGMNTGKENQEANEIDKKTDKKNLDIGRQQTMNGADPGNMMDDLDQLDDLDRADTQSNDSFEKDSQLTNQNPFENLQEKLFEIIEGEEVEDVIDLNEKFLVQQLGCVDQADLALLPKIELRVDTRFHNLQVTGEILSSLEYLKLNDSIIPTFRDIGTSFKNVRVLHVGRCELKEVQGIQAFEQLEELYISYNDIEDLFDIGFIEHLTILDLEGNNVKDFDQLYYLKRCRNLTHVNLKYNPVQMGKDTIGETGETMAERCIEYYDKMEEFVPLIEELDDEAIEDGFFERKKLECTKIKDTTVDDRSFLQLPIAQKIKSMGFSDRALTTISTFDPFQNIVNEPPEERLIAATIKNQTAEKKALRDFQEQVEDFDNMSMMNFDNMSMSQSSMNQSQSNFRTTHASGFKGNESYRAVSRSSKKRQVDPMRESSMRFFKEAFENISVYQGSEAMFVKEKQKVEYEKEKQMRESMQTDNILLEEPVTLSGAPTSFLKSRRMMSARKRAATNAGSDAVSNNSFRQTGNKFFATGANPASTQYNKGKQQISGDIQSIIDGFSQEQSSFKQGLRIKVRQGGTQKRMGQTVSQGFGKFGAGGNSISQMPASMSSQMDQLSSQIRNDATSQGGNSAVGGESSQEPRRMKLKRLKYNKNQGSSTNIFSDKGSKNGFESEDDRGSIDARSKGASAVQQQQNTTVEQGSAIRPKVRQANPRKIKILTGNISSKHIIRSDSQNQDGGDSASATRKRTHLGGVGGAAGDQQQQKLVIKKTDIKLSPNGQKELLNSKTAAARQQYNEQLQQR